MRPGRDTGKLGEFDRRFKTSGVKLIERRKFGPRKTILVQTGLVQRP